MTSLCYNSPIGPLLIKEEDGKIIEISFMEADTREKFSSKAQPDSNSGDALATSACITACIKELDAYFAGKLKKFTVSIKLTGTDFRMKVWDALMTIPYGETISYKQLAERIENPSAIRAVGGANHNNPISIIVPCHRVIGADGKLVGYGGGMDNKTFLLELEKMYV